MARSAYSEMRESFAKQREERARRLDEMLQRSRSARRTVRPVSSPPLPSAPAAQEKAQPEEQEEVLASPKVQEEVVSPSHEEVPQSGNPDSQTTTPAEFETIEAFLQGLPGQGFQLTVSERDKLAKLMANALYVQVSTGFFEAFCKDYLRTYIRDRLQSTEPSGAN